ncbi:hypothetical protein FSARC_5452 [Fusarium sarcochroum]|uniref:Major facilitator superfamily (MFS) profile domain-containing protein n=1 Tax=Fusarium sarcochroum TaxID=1208366 RepID=A0A8H4XAD9_9HYPO|nr:hypothetical protein FSARC_5452 [Fusarium sarcochroum]
MQVNDTDTIGSNTNVPGDVYLIKRNDNDESTAIVLSPAPSIDPNDPLNWPMWRKLVNWMLVFAVTVTVFTSLSIQTNFWQQMSPELNITFEQLNHAQSTNLAGLAMGCILFIPLTKKYGRRLTYILATAVMATMAIWSSKINSMAELYVVNLINAKYLMESIADLPSRQQISDLFFVHQRGRINALYLTAVMFGTFLTPLLAGVQAQNQSWRASYRTLGICLFVLLILFIFTFEETKYIPVLEAGGPQPSQTQANIPEVGASTESTGDEVKTTLDSVPTGESIHEAPPRPKTYRERMRFLTPTSESLWHLFAFPLHVIWLPHILFTALQYAAGIIWLSVMAAMTSRIFSAPPYNFNTAQLGYMGLGPFTGNFIGSIYAGIASDWAVTHLSKKNRGWYQPEFRLYPLIIAAFFQAGGLIMFGTTADRGMHWIYPSIGGAFFAFGLGAMGDITFTFVIDTYRPSGSYPIDADSFA